MIAIYLYISYLLLCPMQSLLWVYLVWVHSQCGLEVLKQFLQFLYA